MAVLGNLLFIVHGSAVLQRERNRSDGTRCRRDSEHGVSATPSTRNREGQSCECCERVPGVVAASFGAMPMLGAQMESDLQQCEPHPNGRPRLTFSGRARLFADAGCAVACRALASCREIPDAINRHAQHLGAGTDHASNSAQRLFPRSKAPWAACCMTAITAVRIVGIVGTLRGAITGRACDNDSILIEPALMTDRRGPLSDSQPAGQMAHVLPLADEGAAEGQSWECAGQRVTYAGSSITHAFRGAAPSTASSWRSPRSC